MTPQIASLMAEYNRWMNEHMYDAATADPSPAPARACMALVAQLGPHRRPLVRTGGFMA